MVSYRARALWERDLSRAQRELEASLSDGRTGPTVHSLWDAAHIEQKRNRTVCEARARVGLTIGEIAAAMGISTAEVERILAETGVCSKQPA